MNQYLVALIGLIAMLAVGYIFYGLIYKQTIATLGLPHSRNGIIMSIIAMYVVALVFTALYNDITLANGAIGMAKGLYLGLMVGIFIFGFTLFADAQYLSLNRRMVWAVIGNWVVSFVVLGLIVGALM